MREGSFRQGDLLPQKIMMVEVDFVEVPPVMVGPYRNLIVTSKLIISSDLLLTKK